MTHLSSLSEVRDIDCASLKSQALYDKCISLTLKTILSQD